MRERKNVKFRTDMYEDTKFKIIDRMVKRDLIHYVWSRSVILAGKINREGDLYMSKNIPFTVETLAIEFNRDMDDVETALNVLIELEMIEVTEDKVYRVKNFAKHQNIKVKEKTQTEEKNEAEYKEKEITDEGNNVMKNKAQREKEKNNAYIEKNEEDNNKVNIIDEVLLMDHDEINSGGINKYDNKINQYIENEKNDIKQHNNSAVILEMKKNQKTSRKNTKANKKKIENQIIETYEDDLIMNDDDCIKNEDNLIENIEEGKEDVCLWTDGEDFSLKDGERLLSEWAF